MTASWPETLPQRYLVDGNQQTFADGRLRSQTDTGPGKVRQRSSAMPSPLSVSLRMNEAQLEILQGFISSDLAGGSLPFTIPAPRGDGTWLVTLGDTMPQPVNIGGDRYNVAMTFLVMP